MVLVSMARLTRDALCGEGLVSVTLRALQRCVLPEKRETRQGMIECDLCLPT